MTSRARMFIVFMVVSVVALSLILWYFVPGSVPKSREQFSGGRAFHHVEAQMAFGPRPTGSDANRNTGNYVLAQLEQVGWQTETQDFTYLNTTVRNILAKTATGRGGVIIIGAHYDTRKFASEDRANPTAPVPGANDGASGVAVLLELARVMDTVNIRNEVWLAFFDAEDNGGIEGWSWIVGSTYMAEHLTITPQTMILLDMIGDKDQQIHIERSSDAALSKQLFKIAADLGYSQHFIPMPKYTILDDHWPFLRKGIPAVDLIDFDYPYWHTTDDTIDKVSSDSLERVGRTVQVFIESSLTSSAQPISSHTICPDVTRLSQDFDLDRASEASLAS